MILSCTLRLILAMAAVPSIEAKGACDTTENGYIDGIVEWNEANFYHDPTENKCRNRCMRREDCIAFEFWLDVGVCKLITKLEQGAKIAENPTLNVVACLMVYCGNDSCENDGECKMENGSIKCNCTSGGEWLYGPRCEKTDNSGSHFWYTMKIKGVSLEDFWTRIFPLGDFTNPRECGFHCSEVADCQGTLHKQVHSSPEGHPLCYGVRTRPRKPYKSHVASPGEYSYYERSEKKGGDMERFISHEA